MSVLDSASFSLVPSDEGGSPQGVTESRGIREMHTYREGPTDNLSDTDEDERSSPFNTSRLPARGTGSRDAPQVYVAFTTKGSGEPDSEYAANPSDVQPPPARRFPSMSDLRRALPSGRSPRAPSPTKRRSPSPNSVQTSAHLAPRRLTALDLPAPGTRSAPKTFHGDCEQVEGFIDHYEKLIKQCNLSTGRERCHNLLLYCAPSVAEFIRVTTSYLRNDWEGLKGEIYKWYNAEVARKRYKPIHVAEYVKKQQREPIYNMTHWNRYYVGFKKRSGRLVSEKLMSPAKEAWYFKNGIHADLWQKIQATLASLDPLHDPAVPFSIEDICAAADVRLKRENFDDMQEDADRFGITPEDTPSDSEEDTDADSESDYSEREYRRRKRERRRRAERKRRTKQSESKKRDKVASSPEEVSTLVRQLNRIRTDEKAYPVIVLREGQTLESALGTGYSPESSAQVRFANNGGQPRTLPSGPSVTPGPGRGIPPHMNEGYMGRQAPLPPQEPRCFGCRRTGHRARDCEELNRLIRENRARRDPLTQRVKLMNNEEINVQPGEGLAQAIIRMTTRAEPRASNHFYEAREPRESQMRTYYATIGARGDEESGDEARYARDINAEALLAAYDLAEKSWDDEEDSSEDEQEYVEDENDGEQWLEDEKGRVFRVVRASMPATRNDRSAVANRKDFMNEPIRRPGLRPPAPRQTVPSKFRESRKSDANRAGPPGVEKREKDAGWPQRKPQAPAPAGVRGGAKEASMRKEEGSGHGQYAPEPHEVIRAPPSSEPVREKLSKGTLPTPNPFNLLPTLRPVDARQPRARHEAREVPSRKEQENSAPTHARDDAFEPSEEPAAQGRGPARIASIALDKDPKEVMAKVLGQQVVITFADFVGVSKEMQKEFREVLQPRSVVRASPPREGAMVHTAIATAATDEVVLPEIYGAQIDEDNLIRLDLFCEGTLVKAIIDTGSQLNVMKESLAQKILAGRPLDTAGALTMNDANGGEGYISGVMNQINLDIGPVHTKADIYLGAKVPFDLLLGRPWQRGNKISIDERDEGTFLIFRDPDTGVKRYEIRVPRHPRGAKGDKKHSAAMLVEHDEREGEVQSPTVNADHSSSRARDSFFVTSHQLKATRAEANQHPQKEDKVQIGANRDEWLPQRDLRQTTNRFWLATFFLCFALGLAHWFQSSTNAIPRLASFPKSQPPREYKNGDEPPSDPSFLALPVRTPAIHPSATRSSAAFAQSLCSMLPPSAPPEPTTPSFTSSTHALSLTTTIIPREELPDPQGQAPAHLVPPINGSLDIPTQLGEVARRFDEGDARGEFPGSLFVFSGRGASLGGGRDREGRYTHDVAIPSATCLSSDRNGRHSATMEDVFLRCYTHTVPAPLNDPLLEPGSNGINSHPPSVDALQRLVPPSGGPTPSALVHCDVPVVADTSRVPARPLTPVYGASSLPPYHAPRLWTEGEAAGRIEGIAAPSLPDGRTPSVENSGGSGSALASTVAPASTVGPGVDHRDDFGSLQPVVLAAFTDGAHKGDSDISSSSPSSPDVPREIDNFDLLQSPRLHHIDLQSLLEPPSALEHHAADAMVIDSPPWVPQSPRNSDFHRLFEGQAEGDSPPWEYFLQYPASPEPAAMEAVSLANETAVGGRVASGTRAPAASPEGQADNASPLQAVQRNSTEPTPEQRLVLLLRAMPPQPAPVEEHPVPPTSPGLALHLLPSVLADAAPLVPIQLNDPLATASSPAAPTVSAAPLVETAHSVSGEALVADPVPRADTPHPNTGIYHRPAKRARGSNDSSDSEGRVGSRFRSEECVETGGQSSQVVAPTPRHSQPGSISLADFSNWLTRDDVPGNPDDRGHLGLAQHSGTARCVRIPTKRGRIRIWTPPGPSPLGRSVESEACAPTLDEVVEEGCEGARGDVEMLDLSPPSPPMFSEADRTEWDVLQQLPHPFSSALSQAGASSERTHEEGEATPSGEQSFRAKGGARRASVSPEDGASSPLPITEAKTGSELDATPPWPIYDEDEGRTADRADHQPSPPIPNSTQATSAPPPPWRTMPTEPAVFTSPDQGEDDGLSDRDAEGDTDDGLTDRDAEGETDVSENGDVMDTSTDPIPVAGSDDPPRAVIAGFDDSSAAEIRATALRLRMLARRLHSNASRTFNAAAVVYEAASRQLDHASMIRAVDDMRDSIAALIHEEVPLAGVTGRNVEECAEESGALSDVESSSSGSGGSPEWQPATPPSSPSSSHDHNSVPGPQSQPPSPASVTTRLERVQCTEETGVDPTRLPNVPYDPESEPTMEAEDPRASPPGYADIPHIPGMDESRHRTPPPDGSLLPEPEAVTLARIFHKALTHTLTAHHVLHEGEVDGEEVETILREITRQLQEEASPILQLGRRRLTYEPRDLDASLLVQQLHRHLAAVEGQVDALEDFVVRRLSRILEDPGFDVVLEAASLRTLFRCVGLDTSSHQLLEWWQSIFPQGVYRAPANLLSVARGAVLHMHPPRDLSRPSVPFGLLAPYNPGHPAHRPDWGYFVRNGWPQIDATRGLFLSLLEAAKGLVSARDWKEVVRHHMLNRTVLEMPGSPFLFIEEAQYLEGLAKVLFCHEEDRLAMLIQCAVRRAIPHLDGYIRGLMRCGYMGGPLEEICRVASQRQEELDGEWKKWRRNAWVIRWAPECPDSELLQRELAAVRRTNGQGSGDLPEDYSQLDIAPLE